MKSGQSYEKRSLCVVSADDTDDPKDAIVDAIAEDVQRLSPEAGVLSRVYGVTLSAKYYTTFQH